MTEEPIENTTETKEDLNNILTVRLIEKYLAYCSGIVKTSLKEGSESYNAQNLFKEIGDELIITPEELVALIDRVQVALDKVD